MTNLQIILAVATIVLTIWQAFILAAAVAILSQGLERMLRGDL